jgi:DNA-binding NarL/FixJ family response regulator
MHRTIPVLVVEDNRLLREGIVAILERQPDLVAVAVAEDAGTALRRVPETRPRVVLVDASLGDQDSHRQVEHITQTVPEARVIVMDLLPAPEDTVGFVKQGKKVLPPALTGTLFSHLAQRATGRPAADMVGAIRMTSRERQIIDLIADGLSNKEIAQRVHLATYTVKSHVHNILEKLALHSRLQLAAYAHKAGRSPDGSS